MNDLHAIAEGIVKQYLHGVAGDIVAMDLMDDDPECQLLTDEEWDKVADMITDASVKITVVVH